MHALARTSAAVLSSLLLAVPATAAPAPTLWDHVGYDAEDSWFNPGERTLTAARVGRLSTKWSVKLRTADTCSDFGLPVVSGGRIFVGDRAGISARSIATGAQQWAFSWDEFGDGTRPRLAVSDGLLIAGYHDCGSVSDPNSRLIALDVATGKKRWAVRTPIMGDLVVDKGVALLSETDGVYGETLTVAYRVRDGRELWRAPNRHTGGSSANGVVAAFTTDGEGIRTGQTAALDIISGAVRWTAKHHLAAGAASPAGDVFYGSDGSDRLAAVGAGDGKVRWTAPPAEDAENYRIAADGARVYRSSNRTVAALDARTGKQLWSRKLKASAGQPLVAGGLVYAEAVVLDAVKGTVVAEGSAFTGDLIVTGGVVYRVHEGTLSAQVPRVS
ncbi:outer membrane protein assembly factor BamB family protein [Actinoplanes italicus]|uniref:outer membrane protein assembly factor BamB family protein n=1 Tax=Actinoplanes italicus TaxID=113567 RepID=UPI0011B1ECE9|nr:PQQ-binding-like beta-propeller repeat protein [Actinoplanes italicus]